MLSYNNWVFSKQIAHHGDIQPTKFQTVTPAWHTSENNQILYSQ